VSKSSKLILFTVGGLVGLAVLVTVVVVRVWSANARPQLEAVASAALGLEVKVGGPLAIHFLPSLHATLQDVHIQNQGADVVVAREAILGIELLPLFHKEVRLDGIGLKHVRISIARDRHGTFNFDHPANAEQTLPEMNLADVSVLDATLMYSNEQSGKGMKADNCNLNASRLRLARGARSDFARNAAVTAELTCGEIALDDVAASDVKLSVEGKDGIFDLKPVTMRLFGGGGSGAVHADFSGSVPLYRVHCSLEKFRIEEFFKTLSPKNVGEGPMDFSADFSMQGHSTNDMKRTATGTASLHGDNLKIGIGDLDKKLSRYESSQSFNLVDVGAFFFAGPLGLGVTKGYDFARTFESSEGSTTIRTLVSKWEVERGVAQAKDVAMTTAENRIALTGALDFVEERFNDVTVAVVDAKGCAKVQQKIRGPFRQPEVEKPDVLAGLVGPMRNLLKQAKGLLGGLCTVFYAGSVAPPK
jgi:AsmA protein